MRRDVDRTASGEEIVDDLYGGMLNRRWERRNYPWLWKFKTPAEKFGAIFGWTVTVLFYAAIAYFLFYQSL